MIAATPFWGACGSRQKPAASAEDTTTAASAGTSAEKALLPPLTPAEAPPGVVARFRLRNPSSTADALLDAMSLPIDLEDLGVFDDAAYLKSVDWSAAVEGAVVLNPQEPAEPYRFVSMGAKSIDAVLGVLEGEAIVPEEAPGGVYYFVVHDEPCAVGRSMGKSPARIVCSDQRDSLRYLVDYALRGLPNEALSDADGYVQVDLRPVRARYENELQRVELLASVGARQLHVGHAKFDRAVTDAAIGVAEEISDILMDTSVIEAELRQKNGDFRTVLKFHFAGERSTMVRTLREHQKQQGPAPELFRGLPATTTYGQYSREISAERAEPWMSVLADLGSGWAEYRGASTEFSTRLSRCIRSLGPSGYTGVVASGPSATVLRNGESALRSKWWVLGTTQPKDQLVQILDDLSWLLASKELEKVVGEPGYTPTLKKLPLAFPEWKGATVYRWQLPAKTKELKEELADRAEVPHEINYATLIDELMDGHIAVHEQGGVTWLTWSSDGPPTDLQKAFQAVVGPERTLQQEVTVADLLTTQALTAGFVKVDGVGNRLAFLVPPEIAKVWGALLRATPGQGTAPSTFIGQVRQQGADTELVYQLDVPKKFTRDVASLVTLIISEIEQK